jgi:hypothetical protein
MDSTVSHRSVLREYLGSYSVSIPVSKSIRYVHFVSLNWKIRK